MNLDSELETQLRQRIQEQISCENNGDAGALYEFIDPDIRASGEDTFPFEKEQTISHFRAFLSVIQSAKCEGITIGSFSNDGGETRKHRPTAIVIVDVLYNEHSRSRFRTPWVLHNGQWYTRALSKTRWPSRRSTL